MVINRHKFQLFTAAKLELHFLSFVPLQIIINSNFNFYYHRHDIFQKEIQVIRLRFAIFFNYY